MKSLQFDLCIAARNHALFLYFMIIIRQRKKNVLMINIVSWYIRIFAYKEWNLVYFLHFHFLPYFSIKFPSNYSLHVRPHEFVYLHSIIRQKLLHQSIFCESVFYESIFGESVFYDSIFFSPAISPRHWESSLLWRDLCDGAR